MPKLTQKYLKMSNRECSVGYLREVSMWSTKNSISSVHLENYGMLQSRDLPHTTQINLVIGGNGTI